ncbi:MAG: hypothetical protein CBB68_02755 [Rhodospirillaceae bacterium TMED8]|nr:hypothetical protein [Magnetovibrio sp.]OUT52294.1 MAG: hypothetical protein CBB68_02755 [Rhodospirillaceae bacterium TMED8]
MRTSTLAILLVSVAVCVGLFLVKYRVQGLEGRLDDLNREIARDREAIRVLRAEWSHLNEPERLRALADRYLGMKPLAVQQIAHRSDWDRKLPTRSKSLHAEERSIESIASRDEYAQ